MSSRSRVVLITLPLTMLIVSCETEEHVPVPFAVHPATTDTPTAEIAGVLELQDGCLTVDGLPLSLPDTSTWNPDRVAVTINEIEFAVGTTVLWGGSYRDISMATDLPRGCGSDQGEVAVVYIAEN